MDLAPARAGSQNLLLQLDLWVARGWLRALDRAFAAFVLELDPQAPPSVLLAAALASFQLGRGHSCLDLQATLQAPDLGLTPATGSAQGGALPSSLLAGLDLPGWRQALVASSLVEDHDSARHYPERPLVLAGQRLYLRRYWNYERSIARALSQRLRLPASAPEDLAARLAALFPAPLQADGERLCDWQKLACAMAARGNFSVITGGPGTGKTTSVVRLLGLLQTPAVAAGKPLRMRLAAPTGKAAARLSESIGRAVSELQVADAVRQAIPTEVATLHRLLGSRPDTRNFTHHQGNPLALDVLVVDEASMIDLEMMACLLDALPLSARLIMLGDKDQLASVDAGAVLGDLCGAAERGGYSAQTSAWLSAVTGEHLAAEGLQAAAGEGDALAQQTVMLRYSRRFDANRGIGRLARLVNQKQPAQARKLLDEQPEQLFDLQLRGEQDHALTRLIVDGHPAAAGAPPGYRHYLEQLQHLRPAPGTAWDSPAWGLWAGQVLGAFDAFRVLCALRLGPWGVEGLNQRVAAELQRQGLIGSEHGWYEGRPVLVTRNDYSLGLMNGDIGIALDLPAADPGAPGQLKLRVAFPRNDGSGGVRFVLPSRLAEVETVYAMTVHKSQGSEFTHTALVLPDSPNPVLTKELLYTGITRARQWFSLVEAAAGVFEGAVGKNVQRVSGLALQLQAELAGSGQD
nr:exodeoxyribonuclease V subunit alpha [Pseudomonas sp. N040]